MKLATHKQSLYLFTLLVAADLAFIALGIIHECGLNKLADVCVAVHLDDYFAITRDRGYAEAFQYLKEYWLIILFGFLAIQRNIKVYLSLVFFSTYLLLDDALGIHEIAGEIIGEKLHFVTFLNVRAQDFGELAFFAVIGTIFFLWFSVSYKLSSSQERKIFKSLIRLLCCLALFAIVVDVIHMMFDNSVFWKAAVGIVEDGGEHIVMSLIISFVWSVVTTNISHNIAITEKKKIAYTRY